MITSFRSSFWTYIPTSITFLFIGIIAYQTISEAYYKKPVMISPQQGQVLHKADEEMYWNYLVGMPKQEQHFQVQVATDREFKNILEKKTVKENHVSFDNILKEPGFYFFRLRLQSNDKTYPWIKPVKFSGPQENRS